MAKFDLGKGLNQLKKGIEKTAKNIDVDNLKKLAKDSVDDMAEKARNIDFEDIKKATKSGVDGIGEMAKNVKLPDTEEIMSSIKKTTDDILDTFTPQEKEVKENKISTRSAMKIIYYLMASDGNITSQEEKKFDELCTSLDSNYASYRKEIIGSCRKRLDQVIDEEDYTDVVYESVKHLYHSSKNDENAYLSPEVLIWNLMTIAYSDDSYNQEERKLIKYLVRLMKVDKTVFLEMESSMDTIHALEKELEWIKSTDRPYSSTAEMVKELENRINTIFEGVKQLIVFKEGN